MDRFAIGALILAGVGAVLSSDEFNPDFSDALLRFYWFRLVDVAIPLAASIGIVGSIRTGAGDSLTGTRSSSASSKPQPWRNRLAAAVAATICVFLYGGQVYQQWTRPISGADRQSLPSYPDSIRRTEETSKNWRRVCEWIRDNTPTDAAFLTPRFQQTFKWHAQRTEFVNWKDVPQDTRNLIEWSRRMATAYGPDWQEPSALWLTPDSLAGLARQYDIQFVVAEQWQYESMSAAGLLDGLECVYPPDLKQRTTYVVLRIVMEATGR